LITPGSVLCGYVRLQIRRDIALAPTQSNGLQQPAESVGYALIQIEQPIVWRFLLHQSAFQAFELDS
jgi:hypothetical protein